MSKKRIVKALVKTTTIEKAIVIYDENGSIEKYESLDKYKVDSVEEIKVISEEFESIENIDTKDVEIPIVEKQYIMIILEQQQTTTIFKKDREKMSDLLFRLKNNRSSKFSLSQEDMYIIINALRSEVDSCGKTNIIIKSFESILLPHMDLKYRSVFWHYDKESDSFIQSYVNENEKNL